MAASQVSTVALSSFEMPANLLSTPASATGMVAQSATQRIGWKFYSATAVTVTSVDVSVVVTGVVTGHTYTLEIETDTTDAPSGTLVGTATSAFAGPAATGFVGAKALGSSAALSANTPYWVVLKVASGTPDGTNFLQARHVGLGAQLNRQKLRTFNGTDWTTVAAVSALSMMVLTLNDGSTRGAPTLNNGRGVSGLTKVFGTNRQGVRYKFGSSVIINGVLLRLAKNSTVGDLDVLVYESTTQKAVVTIPAAEISGDVTFMAWFTSPPTVAAGANVYIVLRQNADGGTSAINWDTEVYTIQAGYDSSVMPADVRFVTGTGNDPTAYTVNTGFAPMIVPLVSDLSSDLVGTVTVTNNIFTMLD